MKSKANNIPEGRIERQRDGETEEESKKKKGKLEDKVAKYYIWRTDIPKTETYRLQNISFQVKKTHHVTNYMNETKHIGIPKHIIKVHNSRNKMILKVSRGQRVERKGRGQELRNGTGLNSNLESKKATEQCLQNSRKTFPTQTHIPSQTINQVWWKNKRHSQTYMVSKNLSSLHLSQESIEMWKGI